MTEQPTLVTEAAVAAARDGGDDAGACITTDQARTILAAAIPHLSPADGAGGDAFAKGAEAMREAGAELAAHSRDFATNCGEHDEADAYDDMHASIRALLSPADGARR